MSALTISMMLERTVSSPQSPLYFCYEPILFNLIKYILREREYTMTPGLSLSRLRLSLLWFALLAATFSTLFILILVSVAPNLRDVALAAVGAATLSSILLWWFLIVRPQRVTIVRGVLAGILSVILSLFLMWVLVGIASGQLSLLVKLAILGLLTMVAVSISPLGWLLMTLGGSIGGTLAFLTRRWAFNNW